MSVFDERQFGKKLIKLTFRDWQCRNGEHEFSVTNLIPCGGLSQTKRKHDEKPTCECKNVRKA